MNHYNSPIKHSVRNILLGMSKVDNQMHYAYCASNPLRFIDPFGLAYRATTDSTGSYTGFTWVDDSEAYDENGNLLDGYFEKAILFSDNIWI